MATLAATRSISPGGSSRGVPADAAPEVDITQPFQVNGAVISRLQVGSDRDRAVAAEQAGGAVPHLAAYEQLLIDHILTIPALSNAKSTFVIRSALSRGPLPLEHWR